MMNKCIQKKVTARNIKIRKCCRLQRTWYIICLLVCIPFYVFAEPGENQLITASYPSEPLVTRLEKIQKQSAITIAFDVKIIGSLQVPELTIENKTAIQVLTLILQHTPFTFKAVDATSVVIVARTPPTASRPGTITGTITDDKGIPLPGATIQALELNQGTVSDANGNYSLNLQPGNYTIIVSYVSYQKQQITNVTVKPNKQTPLNIPLKPSSTEIGEVTVTAEYKKATVEALYAKQKNTVSMTDGLSADLIKKTGDSNMAQVLKRVSGVTIQEGKFVTIRGMSERYNNVQLNGTSMPSTEPNRRNFSFDIIPSSLVDNITVAKTFTPDMQGEFTGGLVEITTLAIPKENFISFTAGTGMNTNSTGKDFKTNKRYMSDYFLGNSPERNWYGNSYNNSEYASCFNTGTLLSQNAEKAYAIGAKIPNLWGFNKYAAAPMQNYAISLGKLLKLGNNNILGATLAGTYRHDENVETIVKAVYPTGTNETKNAHSYKFATAMGAVANIGWENPKHKITLRNLFNNRFTHDNMERVLLGYDNADYRLQQYSSCMRNKLWQSRIEGEHKFFTNKLIVTWFADYNKLNRCVPDERLIFGRLGTLTDYPDYSFPMENGNYKVSWSLAAVGTLGNLNLSEGFLSYNNLDEIKKNIGGNLECPFTVKGNQQKLKIGYWGTHRSAGFAQQYLVPRITAYTSPNLKGLQLYKLMDNSNFADGTLIYAFASPKGPGGDNYSGEQHISAGYLMGDFSFFKKLHLTGGYRMENSETEINTTYYYYDATGTEYVSHEPITRKKVDWLPSATVIYNFTDKINLRAAYSQTLARPDFRELTRFSYYNVYDRLEIGSSHALETTYTTNYDVRLEWYPQPGEVVSLSAYYKYFDSPVEMLTYNPSQSGNYILTPVNLESAALKGVELNLRKSLLFIAPGSFLKNLFLTANASLLKGNVNYNLDKISASASGLDATKFSGINRNRPLIGLSPYTVNAGLDYQTNKLGLAANYATTGRKITLAGSTEAEDQMEAPRHVIDLQISYRLIKGHMLIKANASDLLNQPTLVYSNCRSGISNYIDSDKNYNEGKDLVNRKVRKGSSYSLSISYNF